MTPPSIWPAGDDAIFVWGAVAAMLVMMAVEICGLIAREHLLDGEEADR